MLPKKNILESQLKKLQEMKFQPILIWPWINYQKNVERFLNFLGLME